MRFLRLALKALRLGILRIGPGWMFGLLTINFNRISVHELGAIAVIVAALIGLHHFLSPLQVMWGHLSDRYPLFGYRRTPYVLVSGLVGALIFMALPWLSIALGDSAEIALWLEAHPDQALYASALTFGQNQLLTIILAFVLLAAFGIAMAANGNSAAALVAEVIEEKYRGSVFVAVWLFMIFTSIATAVISKHVMPDYDPQQMQALYSLTLPIVVITSIIGLVGMERRISPQEHADILARPRVEASSQNAFRIGLSLMRSNVHVRRFFFFVLFAICGIFLQDVILEIYGAEVFGLKAGETAEFTQVWGQGMLLGILIIVLVSRVYAITRKTTATLGGVGIACSLGIIALSSATVNVSLVKPGLFLMGISTGFFNIGALPLMMEMTVEGYAGLYMGMWGFAQGFGNGLANLLGGALHTVLIETNLLAPPAAYSLIYSGEAMLMLLAILILRGISVQDFKGVSSADVKAVMAFDTAA